MTNKNVSPIRVSEEYISFSEKLQINRIKSMIDFKTLGHPKVSSLIVKYFKLNNERYLELVKLLEDREC